MAELRVSSTYATGSDELVLPLLPLALLSLLIPPTVTAIVPTPGLAFLVTHLFVIFYEEPTLKRKFGAAYEDYLRRVPRWIPRLTK